MLGIHHRHTTTLPDDPTSDISADEWNDSLVIRPNAGDPDTSTLGDVLLRAPADPDGWRLASSGAGVLACTGAGAVPAFRALTTADLPASPALTGNPTAPTPAPGDNDTSIATTAFVANAISTSGAVLAPLASPTFTGDPKAPTPSAGDSDTSIATTAFVQGALAVSPTTATLTDGATVSLDVTSKAAVYRLAAAGDRTLNITGTPQFGGQKVIIQHFASGGAARTLTLGTMFRFGSDITALTATASGKTDYIGAIYNATDNRWDVVAVTKGF